MLEAGPRITKMRLVVEGVVPGVDAAAFQEAAEAAKDGCPVSNALKGNLEFELEAALRR
jgi:osmotically inducible protein OsmC